MTQPPDTITLPRAEFEGICEALDKIAAVNDVDGNSMECDSHEDCQEVAKTALATANKHRGR